jgi:hypothetical protein
MKPKDKIEQFVAETEIGTSDKKDRQILNEVLQAHEDFRHSSSQQRPLQIWRTIMESKITKLAAAGIVFAVLFVSFFGKLTQPAWAIEQAIKAIQKYKACNVTVVESGGTVFDCWAKAEPSGELSDEVTLKGSNGGVIWVKDNKTYYYDPQKNQVEVDDAKTAGFSPWLGPELLELVSKADDAKTVFGKDPTTGRARVFMTGSMTTAYGPISWSIEFDAESKLPVAYTQWNNTRRSGPPQLSIAKITYFENVPDSFFAVDIPGNVTYIPKPIVIPEANVALLGNPNDGIRTEGLTRVQAARQILEQVYKAAIAGDTETFRKLCPLTQAWSEQLLKAVIMPEDESKRLVEVLQIEPICREGSTRLGPFVVVPTRLKTRDGRVWDEKQIVQFRRISDQESCVVYGPYGMLSEVKE